MPISYKLSELAAKLGLRLSLKNAGDDVLITGINTLEEAGSSDISFLANPKYASQLSSTKAAAVILRPEHENDVERALVAEDPYTAFAYAIALFAEKQGSFSGISNLAFIHPDAVIKENCTIYPFCYVAPRALIGKNTVLFPGCYVGEDSIIGEDCILYPNAVLMSHTKMGNSCVLQPGAVLGGEGFGFIRTPMGIRKIPQIGHVEIGDKVEIGVNSAVDRAALSTTSIGYGTCLDNLVQIGHNVRIGKDCLIVSQTGISGSTHVGDQVTIAGQAGLSGHLHIGDKSVIGPQAGIAKDVAADTSVCGSPALDSRTWLRNSVLAPKLPDLFKRVAQLEKIISKLTEDKA